MSENIYTVEPLVNEHCETGENPLWNTDDNRLYWTDIPRGKLFRYDPATGTHETIYEGEPVGGFTFQADGSLLLFRVRDIARRNADGTVTTLIPFEDEGAKRFNDVIADPEGRVYAGTIGVTRESGGLYRIDRDGTVTVLRRGTGNGNGMAFTADESRFYWTDSTNKRIYRFRWDRATGELSEESVFYQGAPDEGTPDGLTLDVEGNVWSARYRDGVVLKHDAADGRVVDRIVLPVPKITCPAFGGRDLHDLYITTAGGGETPDEGTLYRVRLPVGGRAEYRSRVRESPGT